MYRDETKPGRPKIIIFQWNDLHFLLKNLHLYGTVHALVGLRRKLLWGVLKPQAISQGPPWKLSCGGDCSCLDVVRVVIDRSENTHDLA